MSYFQLLLKKAGEKLEVIKENIKTKMRSNNELKENYLIVDYQPHIIILVHAPLVGFLSPSSPVASSGMISYDFNI